MHVIPPSNLQKNFKNADYSTVFLLKIGQGVCGMGKAVENIQVLTTARSRVAVKRGALCSWLYPPQKSTSGGGCMIFLLHRGEETLMKFLFFCTSPKKPPQGFTQTLFFFFTFFLRSVFFFAGMGIIFCLH